MSQGWHLKTLGWDLNFRSSVGSQPAGVRCPSGLSPWGLGDSEGHIECACLELEEAGRLSSRELAVPWGQWLRLERLGLVWHFPGFEKLSDKRKDSSARVRVSLKFALHRLPSDAQPRLENLLLNERRMMFLNLGPGATSLHHASTLHVAALSKQPGPNILCGWMQLSVPPSFLMNWGAARRVHPAGVELWVVSHVSHRRKFPRTALLGISSSETYRKRNRNKKQRIQ